MSNWLEMLAYERRVHKDNTEIVFSTMSETEAKVEFDAGYGGTNGIPFTVWSESRVYFPIMYDGSEWVESVSRNPENVPTEHFGGG